MEDDVKFLEELGFARLSFSLYENGHFSWAERHADFWTMSISIVNNSLFASFSIENGRLREEFPARAKMALQEAMLFADGVINRIESLQTLVERCG